MCHHFPDRNMQKHLFSRWRMEVSNSVLDPEQTVQCCSNFIKVMYKKFTFKNCRLCEENLTQYQSYFKPKVSGTLENCTGLNRLSSRHTVCKHFRRILNIYCTVSNLQRLHSFSICSVSMLEYTALAQIIRTL